MTARSGGWGAFALSAVLGAAIWAFSRTVTGRAEPWDANSAYYPVALAIAGLVAGLLPPPRVWRAYAGVIAGQALYMAIASGGGGLFVLGVLLVPVYSLPFLAAIALLAWARRRLGLAPAPESEPESESETSPKK